MKSILFMLLFVAGGAVFFGSHSLEDGGMMKQDEMNNQADAVGTATFAGGCFWCTEADFQTIDGVIEAVSGYTGGRTESPTYEEVCSGNTGHVEAVQVTFDPHKISYARLLDEFWRHIDPTDPGGQFSDRGSQYRTVIFYHNEEQRRLAELSKKALDESGHFDKPVVTEILPAVEFYEAEDSHQNFCRINPLRYELYREGSGRNRFLEKAWREEKTAAPVARERTPYTKPDEKALKKRLSPLQYTVTQEGGTEHAFRNEYWDNKRAGIYVDVISGEPLFSSLDKYDSGTGWPSFTRPLDPERVVEKNDSPVSLNPTEVRSKDGDSHLGHVFPDGPAPTGLRYCLNSAALRFIPVEDLEKEGYGRYLELFSNGK